jgi:asparagine N-glycosylation enzyme membrane subunit Stt3
VGLAPVGAARVAVTPHPCGYKGGIVEVDPRMKDGVGYNLVTMKFPLREAAEQFQNSMGWGYQINAVIPTENRTYVIQVAAIEQGTTGVREATVTVILSAKDGSKDPANVMKRFRRDPYDQLYDDGGYSLECVARPEKPAVHS